MTDTIIEKIKEQIGLELYPGASLALYDKRWEDFYLGTQDGSQPVTGGLTYDLASVSKVVGVGTCLIALMNKGMIDLDKPLSAYYPAFQDETVSIRQLATHTSGIVPFIPNRNAMDANQLRQAINQIKVTADKTFMYTDINFLLLGFMLEDYYGQSLNLLFETDIFQPLGMWQTRFGPVDKAVPTVRGEEAGLVHDPKARVLGNHAGSAGLFSTLTDLKLFLDYYLTNDFSKILNQDYGYDQLRERSIAWDKKGGWLMHTGYTGTFVMYHRQLQKAAIFLANRTFYKDDRYQWKKDRNELMRLIQRVMERQT